MILVRRSVAAFGAGLFLLVATAAHSVKLDSQIRSKRSDLRKVNAELTRKTSEREEAARKAKQLALDADRIARELASARQALKGAESRVRDTERRRKSTEERLWASRLEMGQWGDLLARELRAYYERQAFLRTAGFVEMAYRRATVEDKRRGLAFARQQHAQVEGLRDDLLALEIELQKLRLTREKEEARVQTARRAMQVLYRTVQGRRAILEREIRELKDSGEALETLVRSLVRRQEEAEAAGRTARSAPASNRRRGRLPWPVEGSLTERFGRTRHPELDTYVFSNGVKIRPAADAPVRAVDKGVVLYAGEFMSYGLMALVQHGDDLHGVYARLGRLDVARGQKVSVGEVVGAPGQDDQGRPVVYFELRWAGAAVDPLLWLQ